jgi:hypothetical protein
MRSSEVYFDDTGKIRKVYAPDEFIAENIEIEKKMAAEAAEANKRARLEQSREILKFYNKNNQLQKKEHHQQQPQQSDINNNTNTNANNNNNKNNVLRGLQLMRKIAGNDRISDY